MPRAKRYVPEHWETVVAGLYAWAAGASLGLPVVWKDQNGPAPAKPYVGIGMITPPGPVADTSKLRARAVAVLAVNDAELYRVTVDAVNYDFTSGVGATLAEIRTGLLAALGSLGVSFFFDASGLLLIIDSDAEVTVSANLLEKTALFEVGESEFTLSVDVYASIVDGAHPNVASPYAIALARSLKDDTRLEALRIAGLAIVEVTGARRPLLVRNGAWEDRAGFDVRFRVLTRTGVLIDWVEDAGEIVGTFSGGIIT